MSLRAILLDAINELVNEDAFLIDQLRQHAGAFNLHRLIQENDDQNGSADREKYVAGPAANFADDTLDSVLLSVSLSETCSTSGSVVIEFAETGSFLKMEVLV